MNDQIMAICFKVCIGCIIVGVVLGLASIWVDELWANVWVRKLGQTAGILFGTSLAVAVVSFVFGFFMK